MNQVIFAVAEFLDARRWYRRRSSDIESQFVASVKAAVQIVGTHPELGALFLDRYRWVRTRRYPYLLYFAPLDSTTVMVYAVAHKRRRLGYWLRRVNRP